MPSYLCVLNVLTRVWRASPQDFTTDLPPRVFEPYPSFRASCLKAIGERVENEQSSLDAQKVKIGAPNDYSTHPEKFTTLMPSILFGYDGTTFFAQGKSTPVYVAAKEDLCQSEREPTVNEVIYAMFVVESKSMFAARTSGPRTSHLERAYGKVPAVEDIKTHMTRIKLSVKKPQDFPLPQSMRSFFKQPAAGS